MLRNPLKYYGSKAKLAPWLSEFVPKNCHTMIDPFFGSGSLVFYLLHNNFIKQAYCSDGNKDLINFWRVVQQKNQLKNLVDACVDHQLAHSKEYFLYNLKSVAEDQVCRAATFHYLNKTAFNGLWRKNKKGELNMSFNNVKAYSPPKLENLEFYSNLLQKINLTCIDYEDSYCSKADFLYLDPPYAVEKGQRSIDYGLLRFDHFKFHSWVKGYLNSKIMLSHVKNDQINTLFASTLPIENQKDYQYTASCKPQVKSIETIRRNYV